MSGSDNCFLLEPKILRDVGQRTEVVLSEGGLLSWLG
jgi:hypothetical protein